MVLAIEAEVGGLVSVTLACLLAISAVSGVFLFLWLDRMSWVVSRKQSALVEDILECLCLLPVTAARG